jgi:hypothetical protein
LLIPYGEFVMIMEYVCYNTSTATAVKKAQQY